jgi:seryl-tRNA synthetase
MSDLLGSSFYAGLAGRNADQANANLRAANAAVDRADQQARVAREWKEVSQKNKAIAEHWIAYAHKLEGQVKNAEANSQKLEDRLKQAEQRILDAEAKCRALEARAEQAGKTAEHWMTVARQLEPQAKHHRESTERLSIENQQQAYQITYWQTQALNYAVGACAAVEAFKQLNNGVSLDAAYGAEALEQLAETMREPLREEWALDAPE